MLINTIDTYNWYYIAYNVCTVRCLRIEHNILRVQEVVTHLRSKILNMYLYL